MALRNGTLEQPLQPKPHYGNSDAMVKRYAHLTEGHTASVVARMTQRFMSA